MTRQRHYHPLAALHFLRKAVVVCLLPLANALLEFSLNALLTALRQDAALLLFLCGASSILLLRTPLLRLGGVSLLIVAAPGAKLFLPAIPAQQAGLLAHILAEDAP